MATQDRGVGLKAVLRLRVAHSDAHYAGNLASGSYVLGLFGDVATELLIRLDGDEGLFRAYDNIDFLAPVNGGDFLEVEGEIVKVGNTSRAMRFEARKVAANDPSAGPSAGKVFAPPVVVVRATGTCVTPKELQRHS